MPLAGHKTRGLEVELWGDHLFGDALLRDIDERGASVELMNLNQPWAIDDWMEIVIHLPDCAPLATHGVIRHRTRDDSDRELMLIEFVDLLSAQRESLRDLIAGEPIAAVENHWT